MKNCSFTVKTSENGRGKRRGEKSLVDCHYRKTAEVQIVHYSLRKLQHREEIKQMI